MFSNVFAAAGSSELIPAKSLYLNTVRVSAGCFSSDVQAEIRRDVIMNRLKRMIVFIDVFLLHQVYENICN
jgi:hypothetical protein